MSSAFVIPEVISNYLKQGRSQSTFKSYSKALKRLYQHTSGVMTPIDPQHLRTNHKEIIEFISKLEPSNANLTTQSIIHVLNAVNAPKSLVDKYERLAKSVRESAYEKVIKREPTQQEIEAKITWKEIESIRDEYKYSEDLNDKQRYVLLSLLTRIPVQRGEVYYNGYMYLNPTEEQRTLPSVIDVERKELIINKHKTVKFIYM